MREARLRDRHVRRRPAQLAVDLRTDAEEDNEEREEIGMNQNKYIHDVHDKRGRYRSKLH